MQLIFIHAGGNVGMEKLMAEKTINEISRDARMLFTKGQ